MSKEKISGIYKITSPSGKIYIGQSIDIERRFNEYQNLNCKSQRFLFSSLSKHGADKHLFEILKECYVEELNKWERFFQIFYINCGYKLGKNLINHRVTGDNDHSGYVSKETKIRLSQSLMGHQISQETRDKISKSTKGRNAPNKGIPMSEEQKEKCKKSNTNLYGKKIYLYDLNGILVLEFNSIRECSFSLNIDRRSIQRALNGTYSKFKGFVFLYENEPFDKSKIKKSNGNNISYKIRIYNNEEEFIKENLIECAKYIFPSSNFTKKYLSRLIKRALDNKKSINGYYFEKVV